MTRLRKYAAVLFGCAFLVACGEPEDHATEKGSHGGRILRDGGFAIEVTIFEEGTSPEFRLYPYQGGKPLSPQQVKAAITLVRLGGRVDHVGFEARQGYLRGTAIVREPHSFDVELRAIHEGRSYRWTYESHEGRTQIDESAAKAGGIATEKAGPATLAETISLSGRIELQPQGRSEVRAWYPGRILSLSKEIGDRVTRGEPLARVESSESLQAYTVPVPMTGVVMERRANVGDVSGSEPLYVIADVTKVHAEFFAYPSDAERLRPGQPISIRGLTGTRQTDAAITAMLPAAHAATQTIIAHVDLPNGNAEWRPGMGVEGLVTIAQVSVALAVRTQAIQKLGAYDVVFVKVGNVYEARPLELGRRTPEWTEVLEGLSPGAVYVSRNAFLVRADIEKSGTAHEH